MLLPLAAFCFKYRSPGTEEQNHSLALAQGTERGNPSLAAVGEIARGFVSFHSLFFRTVINLQKNCKEGSHVACTY